MISEIAASCEVPRSFLAKILQRLARAGIVRSYRGAGGGFQLVRSADALSLREVVETMQGPIALNICAVDPDHCSRSGGCVVHPVWVRAGTGVERILEKQTFGRLLREEKRHGQDMASTSTGGPAGSATD